MANMDALMAKALDCGFDHAAQVEVENLKPIDSVRDSCAENKCHSYDKNWGCPPGVGTLEECGARIQTFEHALLLQTVGQAESKHDFEYVTKAAKRHDASLRRFAGLLRADYPKALCLGAGGCTVCPTCAYPDPCRFPDKQLSSMEAYGLFVTGVTKTTDLKYYYGKGTIAYAACCLF